MLKSYRSSSFMGIQGNRQSPVTGTMIRDAPAHDSNSCWSRTGMGKNIRLFNKKVIKKAKADVKFSSHCSEC